MPGSYGGTLNRRTAILPFSFAVSSSYLSCHLWMAIDAVINQVLVTKCIILRASFDTCCASHVELQPGKCLIPSQLADRT